MINKKLLLPIIILAVSVAVMAVVSLVFSIALKPTITEGEFPFSITYEIDGETVTIKDVYRARYEGNAGYADTKFRVYGGEIGDRGEGNTLYILKENADYKIVLYTHFYADHLMGDTEYDYFDREPFEPRIYCYNSDETELFDDETLASQGVKLISFEYPTPIKNSFVFSHLSYFSGIIVIPTLIIALLSLFAIIIFVKKESDLKYKTIDIISIVLNFIISFIYLPFVSILALLIDIEGGGPEFYYQAMYFIPAITVLFIAASVALRRKGYSVRSLIFEFVGPSVFALYLIAYSVIASF